MYFSDVKNSTILFSVLDWGLGHVSRSLSILHNLQKQGNTLIIACDDAQKVIFSQYFPEIRYENLEGYNFDFEGKGKFGSDLWKNRKKLLKTMKAENLVVEELRKKHDVKLVISDHRYGFFSSKIPSIFITHQLHLPLLWYQKVAQWIHERFLSSFSALWVLDYEDSRLAGKLSQAIKHKCIRYLGPQSRFLLPEKVSPVECDTVYIISGPSPYDQQFLAFCLEKAKANEQRAVIICPPHLLNAELPGELTCIPSFDWQKADAYIRGCKQIISRSGYSTIMDVHVLHKKSSYFPTRGQAEQEYLAELHN